MPTDTVTLTVDNQKVSAKFYKPQGRVKELALLFLHGWTGKPNENAARIMAEKGYYCLTIIMRGHDGSDGDITKITAKDSLHDAIVAYDFLKEQLPRNTEIVAIGNSYGSYIAVLLSGQRQLTALSLRVPAAYPDNLYGKPKWGRGNDDPAVAAWRKQPVDFSANMSFMLLHDFRGEVQIIEAENDDIVPMQTVKNYVNAISDGHKLEYKLMKGWPHSLGDNLQRNNEFQAVLLNWVNKVEAGL